MDRVIEQDPQAGDAYFSKGLLLLSLKRPTEAEQTIRAGLSRSPDAAIGHYHLGRVLLEEGKTDEAIVSFERAASVNPAFEPAYLALGSIYESRHERDRAVAVLKKYLQNVNPRNRDIRHQLVRLYIDAKDYQSAKKELEDLLADDPSDLDAQLRMALIYGEQKEYPKAIDVVAFGRPFISNPDLVRRLREDAPLNEPRADKFYGGGAEGYIDYPTLGSD